MKQTNNAIKFLMAQYRAIFKHAYLKGIASAVVLTAGLATASTANAAELTGDNTYWYYTGSQWVQTKDTGTGFGDTSSNIIAGAVNSDHSSVGDTSSASVSGSNFNIGTNGQLSKVSGISSTAPKIAAAVSERLNGGDASATSNTLTLLSDGKVDAATSLYGAYVKAKQGFAYANDNHVIIKAGAALAPSNQYIQGAIVQGNKGGTAIGNSVEISGTGVSTLNLTQNIFGARAEGSGTTPSGSFIVQGNSISLTNLGLGKNTQDTPSIVGGFVAINDTSFTTSTELDSSQNSVILRDVQVGASGDTTQGRIVANYAQNAGNQNKFASVTANGSETSGLTITNSNLYGISLQGGHAVNISGGSATASDNKIKLADTNLYTSNSGQVKSGINGAYVESALSGSAAVVLTASNNSVEITNSDFDLTKGNYDSIQGNVIGARISLLDPSKAKNASGSTITANGNIVTVGEGVDVVSGSVYGVSISKGAGVSGASVTANDNQLTFNGKTTGNLITVNTPLVGNFANITNNVDAQVTGTLGTTIIAGVNITDAHTTNKVSETSKINVNIGENAEIKDTDIWAVKSKQAARVVNSNVTIKGDITNANIYGGATDSQNGTSTVSLENGSKLTLNTSTTTEFKIASDTVKLDGDIHVANSNNTLSIQGFLTDGKLNSTPAQQTYNTNETNIGSSAKIYNAGTINFYGKTTVDAGAELHALINGSKLVISADSSKYDTVYTDNDVKNLDKVGGTGSLALTEAQVKSYLKAGDQVPETISSLKTDVAGVIQVTSGGALEFTDDKVVLSKLDFDDNAASPTAGRILVDDDVQSGKLSILKGKTVVIEHQLAQNGSKAEHPFTTADNDLTALSSNGQGIQIEAETLQLGSNQLEEAESAKIQFDNARAKNEIDFTVKSGSFQLTSAVAGNNYMRTQDQAEDLDYYTALNGTINGDVNITSDASDSGKLTIEYGNWTAKDEITISSGGALNVGIANNPLTQLPLGNHNSLPDATLTLDKALTLDVSKNGTATIDVDGQRATSNGLYDFEDAAGSIGDDHLVLLDLSKGLKLELTNAGKVDGVAEINVASGGIIKLNATDLNDILAANNNSGANATAAASGAFFNASDYGVFDVAGDVETNFTDFGGGNGHNGITLGQNGYLVADSLSVLNQHNGQVAEDAQYQAKSLNLGDEDGTVVVGDLVISDLQQTKGTNKPTGSNEYASKVVFAQGTAIVSKSLTSNNNTLVLGDGSNTAAHIKLASEFSADEGKVDVANIQIDNGSFAVDNGIWDASKTTFKLSGTSRLTVGGEFGEDAKEVAFAPSLQASGIVLDAGTSLDIAADGTASFDTADFSKLTANGGVSVAGTLIINGSADAKLADGKDDPANGVDFGAAGSIQIEKNGVLQFGSLATNGAIIADGTYTGADSIKMQEGYTQIANSGGELHLGLASSTKFDGEAIKALKSALFTTGSFNDGVLVDGGVLNIGQATFSGIQVYDNEGEGLSGYKAAWKDLKVFSDIYGSDVTNDKLVQTNAYDIGVGDQVQGHWGSLTMSSNVANSAQVTIAGNTSLRFAEGNNGFFISNAAHTEARGAIVESQKDLTLIGGGEIGKVTLKEGANGTDKNLTVLEVRDGDTTIAAIEGSQAGAGIADYTYVDINSNTTVTGDINNIDTVGVYNGAKLTAANAKVASIETENATAWIKGNLNFIDGEVIGGLVQVDDTATMTEIQGEDHGLTIAHNGTFKAKNFVASSNGYIEVGFDSTNETYTLDDGTKILGTGYFDVDTLKLNNATIVVDPAYGEKTSVAGTLHFQKNKETFGVNDAGTLVGSMQIGANAAYGVGANVADTLAAIATYQTNGSLSKDKYGSILYLNGQLTVDQGSEIALNSDDSATTDIRDSLKYTRENLVLDQYADLGLGANTAILMTEQAFEDKDGKRNGTAIFFNRQSAVVNGAGGDILLSGTFDASDKLNIFNDIGGSGVKVEGSIDVMTQNGFLYATLSGENAGMGVQLEVDKDKAYSIMSEASDPVVETLISYHADRIGQTDDNTSSEEDVVSASEIQDPSKTEKTLASRSGADVSVGGDTPETPSTPDQGTGDNAGDTGGDQGTSSIANTKVSGNSEFLNEVVNTSHGAPAESAARLAVYGGAAQAALTANTANTEVIAARLGVGAQNSALSFADNGQGAGLWVAPIYKNHDSDGFSAQGLNYGVDMDLYGLALGGDYTLANGIRVGAMFNVGSGDADGQGNAAAANTSNDFDYWGVAVYGGYSFDALSITADIGYTVVDNDLEATTGMENTTKLTASTDTSALTFGVTGQYKFDFDGLVVAPHAGLRYTYLDMDDYTVKGNEDVASYSADSMSIFSIPVGVAVSKEFAAGEWTVKPSFDLTLTANLGDDSMDGNVTWANVNNLSTHVESEMVDSFTYGASLGVAAKTGNFSLGFGINYTGASNADEYGVNANARFVF